MNPSIRIRICIPLLFIASACSKLAQNPVGQPATPAASQRITSQSVVDVAAQPTEIAAGGSADATVRVTIKSGYHINANPPTYPYLKATSLEISPTDDFSVSFVTYPEGSNKKFPFAEKPLAIYEGDTELKATLKAKKSAKPGEQFIPASLRIQACDDQVCYPPGQIELRIPVTVK
ncbi:MAG: protein-disulfide reductase DsbD domain-containing protein [bacterium]